MWLLRTYLLIGLVAHKSVWAWLKRRAPATTTEASAPLTVRLLLVKTVKVAILLGLMGQVFVPDVLPIVSEASWLRVVGTLIYTVGWFVAVLGRVQLGDNWADIETPAVVASQQVVSRGVYRYIRHPIYVGDLMLLCGLELALNSYLVLGVALLAPVVAMRAVREEALLGERLPGYHDYCRKTKRFIPFVV